jgi:uncharacterized protein (TIGR03000 family)
MPSDAAPPAAPPEASTYNSPYGSRTAATVSVTVPSGAKIYVNGMATTSTGSNRQFISRGLKAGARYSYEVRAEIVRDGKTVTETKQVQLRAGENADLAFALSGEATEQTAGSEPVKTKLTVRVPAEAKLYLAGREMQSTGPVREFTTAQLQNGDVWSAYTVRVELERDGQILSKDQTISLAAGETRELTFDFDTDKVANATR